MPESVESGAIAAPALPAFARRGATSGYWSERLAVISLAVATILSASSVVVVFWFVLQRAIPIFSKNGLGFLTNRGWEASVLKSFHEGSWVFGAAELFAGTALTTLWALALTVIIGMGAAVALAEYAPPKVSRPIESVIRLLAALPSVVFGLVGIELVAPWIESAFITNEMKLEHKFISTGQTLLAAIVVLTFMIIPFFVSVTIDSLRAVPRAYRLGGHALGLPKWEVTMRLVVPVASPGILAGLVLAAARGIGEAIALAMVSGSVAHIPDASIGLLAFLEPVRTTASAIISQADIASSVPPIQAALFGLGTLILLISFALSALARLATIGFQKRMRLVSGRSL